MKEQANELDEFRVRVDKLVLEYWDCGGEIYISDICIALKLAPKKIADCVAARDELYRTLRGVWQTALCANLARPVVGVIHSGEPSTPLSESLFRQFSRWASDQNWHQGHFSLYVEPLWAWEKGGQSFKVDEILLDLLAPEPLEIVDIQQRTIKSIKERLNEELPESGKTQPGVDDIKSIIYQAWDDDDLFEAKEPQPLQAWIDQIMAGPEA